MEKKSLAGIEDPKKIFGRSFFEKDIDQKVINSFVDSILLEMPTKQDQFKNTQDDDDTVVEENSFSPISIALLIFLNLVVVGLVGGIVYSAVAKADDDTTKPPKTITTLRPTISPSVPLTPVSAPTPLPTTKAPTSSPSKAPTTMSPTEAAEFVCYLCGEGKIIEDLLGEISFSSRLTVTCGDLQMLADSGDIVQTQCELLQPQVAATCKCTDTLSR